MIPFNKLPENIVEVLKANDIKETDLFNHYSDLYVGCNTYEQALNILNGGAWRSLSGTFMPQKGSDMDNYTIGVDIAFGAMQYHMETKQVVYES